MHKVGVVHTEIRISGETWWAWSSDRANTFVHVRGVFDAVLDIIVTGYHEKPLIFIRATFYGYLIVRVLFVEIFAQASKQYLFVKAVWGFWQLYS